MIRGCFYLLSFLFFTPCLKAQEIFEADRPMSLGLKPAQVVELPLKDSRSIEKMWDDYMKDNYGMKLKRNRKADEYYNTEAELLNIGGSEEIEFYSRVEEKQDNCELAVWIYLKGGFLTETEFPAASKTLREILVQFENVVRIEKIQRALESEEDKLKDLDKELDNLRSDKEKYEKNIEKARQEIQENEQDIEQNLKEQKTMQKKRDQQQMVIQKVQARIDKLKGK